MRKRWEMGRRMGRAENDAMEDVDHEPKTGRRGIFPGYDSRRSHAYALPPS